MCSSISEPLYIEDIPPVFIGSSSLTTYLFFRVFPLTPLFPMRLSFSVNSSGLTCIVHYVADSMERNASPSRLK